MDIHPALVFLVGLTVIIVGAEVLLHSASRIASMLGIQPIVIGLTVVTVGTTMPELAVGITAAAEGKASLAVGNIAGTNLLNILFILGLSALIRPLPIRLQSIRLHVPVMISSTLALIAMGWDGLLSRTEGTLLVLAAIAYTVTLVRMSRRETTALKQEFSEEYGPSALQPGHGAATMAWHTLQLLAGMAAILLGAHLLVLGAGDIARSYGVSDAIIGLTIVAIGTSAPELVTTIVATLRNDRDVAIGNLIGSSIYNILVILGITCLSTPAGIEVEAQILHIDLPLAAAVALVCLPVFRSDAMVSRREGAAFVAAYLVYLGTLLFMRV